MTSKRPLNDRVDEYFSENFQETILLNHLSALRRLQRIRSNYVVLIDKIISTDETQIFNRYLSRDQLLIFAQRITTRDVEVNKQIYKKLEYSVENYDDNDLLSKVNTFQLIGANGKIRNFDFVTYLVNDIKCMHKTIWFTYLNVSLYTTDSPFDVVDLIYDELNGNIKLQKFYYSYLKYYYNGVDNIFKLFRKSVIDKLLHRTAVLIPALETIVNVGSHRYEVQEIICKNSEFFDHIPSFTSRKYFKRLTDVIKSTNCAIHINSNQVIHQRGNR